MPPLMVPLPAGTAAAQYAAPPAEVVVPTKLYNRPPGEIAEMPAKKQRPPGQRKKKRR